MKKDEVKGYENLSQSVRDMIEAIADYRKRSGLPDDTQLRKKRAVEYAERMKKHEDLSHLESG